MTNIITGTGGSHVPDLIDGYRSTRTSRNVLHTLAGSQEPAITLRPAGLRRGSLTALFSVQAEALALEADLAAGQTLTFDTDELTDVDMTFVLDGSLVVELDRDTRSRWTVTFDFQEVS